MKKFRDRLQESAPRIFMALLCLFFAVVLTLLLGIPIFLISGDLRAGITGAFWLVAAPFLVAILLLFVTTIPEVEVIGYGCGLYYGTIVLASLMRTLHFRMNEEARYIVSFVIVSLSCCIVYLKRKRPQ